MKTAVVSFFDAYPPKSGAGVVICDFFNSWPDLNKCLFQMSAYKFNKDKIKNINIFFNKPIFKLFFLPSLILKLLKYFNNEKKKILIIEGASWIFYSYFVIFFLKKFLPNVFIIYRSHNIEYEIRKKRSSFFIYLATKYFEKKVFTISDISTTVSVLEKKKVKKYYGVQTKLFPNSIRVNDYLALKFNVVKNLPKKYILFCGSYEYSPNKFAIDFIINKILPSISKKNIYLVLTGTAASINFNDKNIINLHYVKKSQLKFLYKNAICLMVTLSEGYGTRVKIIESLILGSNIITTHKGIEGIDYKDNVRIVVTNSKKKMIKSIYNFMNSKSSKLKNSNKSILKYYSMEKNASRLHSIIK